MRRLNNHRNVLRCARQCVVGVFAAAALLLTGCVGMAVSVKTKVPPPLVESIPIKVAVVLEPPLDDYEHTEDLGDYGKFSINMNESHVQAFDVAFNSMFEEVVNVSSLADAPDDADATLVVSIVNTDVAVPAQTRSELFEVWLNYSVEVYDGQGNLVHDWPVIAYGKSHTQDFGFFEKGSTDALRNAAFWAIRDAIATVTLGFAREPAIRSWLAGF